MLERSTSQRPRRARRARAAQLEWPARETDEGLVAFTSPSSPLLSEVSGSYLVVIAPSGRYPLQPEAAVAT